MWGFIFIYVAWDSLCFLNLKINIFHQSWKVLFPNVVPLAFSPFSSFSMPNTVDMSDLLILFPMNFSFIYFYFFISAALWKPFIASLDVGPLGEVLPLLLLNASGLSLL